MVYNVGLRLNISRCSTMHVRYTPAWREIRREKVKKRWRKGDGQIEMPRRCYGVTPSLSAAAVIVRGKLYSDEKEINSTIESASLRLEPKLERGNATESGLNSNGCYFFEYHVLRERCFIRLWLFSSCSVTRNKSIRRNSLFYNYNTSLKL